MKRTLWLAPMTLLLGAAAPQARDELVVAPDALVAAEVAGMPARIHLRSAGPDRLVLNSAFVEASGLRPARLFGKGELNVSGRQEFRGHNRPLRYSIAGMAARGRAFWFTGAPPNAGDGTIGPWAVPQPRVTFVLRPFSERDARFDMPLTGSINSASLSWWKEAGFAMTVAFDLDSASRYPVATAAAGGAIARAYGGILSGPSWDVPLGMGVKRPVRLMTLARPFAMGPFAFTRIAVRVRDRIDAGGRGEAIRDADDIEDPDEIVVRGWIKGPAPAFGITLPRPALAHCARLTYDKRARRISVWCAPAR